MIKTPLRKLLALAVLILAAACRAHSQTNVFLVQTTAWYRAETTVPELTGLTMVECIQVLNLRTNYQVNLELCDYDPQSRYRLDLVGLQKQPIEEVLTKLLSQTGDYAFIKTNNIINVIPKKQMGNVKHVFNTALSDYKIDDQNLVGAWEALCHQVPALVIIQPVSVAIDSKPKWIADQKVAPEAGHGFSLSLSNVSARNVVNALAKKYGEDYLGDDYWVAQPSPEIPPKWYWIVFYRKGEGKYVLWKHDPGLREQRQRYMEKAE